MNCTFWHFNSSARQVAAWLGLASGLFRRRAPPGQRTAGVHCCGKGAFTTSRLGTFSFRFCEKLRGDTTVVILRLMSCFVFLTERSLCWQRFQLPQCFDCVSVATTNNDEA